MRAGHERCPVRACPLVRRRHVHVGAHAPHVLTMTQRGSRCSLRVAIDFASGLVARIHCSFVHFGPIVSSDRHDVTFFVAHVRFMQVKPHPIDQEKHADSPGAACCGLMSSAWLALVVACTSNPCACGRSVRGRGDDRATSAFGDSVSELMRESA